MHGKRAIVETLTWSELEFEWGYFNNRVYKSRCRNYNIRLSNWVEAHYAGTPETLTPGSFSEKREIMKLADAKKAQRYKLLAIDIDGTALNSQSKLSQRTKESIREAIATGAVVLLCTGRRFRTTLPIIAQLGLKHPVIIHNGVVIKEVEGGTTIYSTYLDEEKCLEAMGFLKGMGKNPIIFVDRYKDGFDMVVETTAKSHPYQEEYLSANTKFIKFTAKIGLGDIKNCIQLSLIEDIEELSQVEGKLLSRFGQGLRAHIVKNVVYPGWILEVFNPKSSKWEAIAEMARRYGIDPAQTVAVGDDRNDVEMIEKAALGVAMGNAVDEVKKAADLVVGSNDEDGLVEVIRRFFL